MSVGPCALDDIDDDDDDDDDYDSDDGGDEFTPRERRGRQILQWLIRVGVLEQILEFWRFLTPGLLQLDVDLAGDLTFCTKPIPCLSGTSAPRHNYGNLSESYP